MGLSWDREMKCYFLRKNTTRKEMSTVLCTLSTSALSLAQQVSLRLCSAGGQMTATVLLRGLQEFSVAETYMSHCPSCTKPLGTPKCRPREAGILYFKGL